MHFYKTKKSVLVNLVAMCVLCVPCVLGFSIWSGIQPLGEGHEVAFAYLLMLFLFFLPFVLKMAEEALFVFL